MIDRGSRFSPWVFSRGLRIAKLAKILQTLSIQADMHHCALWKQSFVVCVLPAVNGRDKTRLSGVYVMAVLFCNESCVLRSTM